MLSKKGLSTNSFTLSLMIIMTLATLIYVSSNNKVIVIPLQTQPSPENESNTNNNSTTTKSDTSTTPTFNNSDKISDNDRLSFWGYMNKKAVERTSNPTLPPERSYEQTYGVPVNIPTRGIAGGYQQIGTLHKETVDSESISIGANSDPVILPLYGRPVHPGSNKWAYYTSSDKYNSVKLPISNNGRACNNEYGCTELYDNDTITLPAYNGNFKVTVYDYDKPHYIPYI